jgi:nitrite reductase/ring-hydroxylating ferredoxin subunit
VTISGWREHRAAPGPGVALCLLADLPDGEGREVVLGNAPEPLRIVVVRRGAQAWAYRNCCPHNYIALNDQPDRFTTFDHEWLICSAHGAVFRYEDGFCEDGPCRGRSLESVPVVVVDGVVRVA